MLAFTRRLLVALSCIVSCVGCSGEAGSVSAVDEQSLPSGPTSVPLPVSGSEHRFVLEKTERAVDVDGGVRELSSSRVGIVVEVEQSDERGMTVVWRQYLLQEVDLTIDHPQIRILAKALETPYRLTLEVGQEPVLENWEQVKSFFEVVARETVNSAAKIRQQAQSDPSVQSQFDGIMSLYSTEQQITQQVLEDVAPLFSGFGVALEFGVPTVVESSHFDQVRQIRYQLESTERIDRSKRIYSRTYQSAEVAGQNLVDLLEKANGPTQELPEGEALDFRVYGRVEVRWSEGRSWLVSAASEHTVQFDSSSRISIRSYSRQK